MPWYPTLTNFSDGGTPTAAQLNEYLANIEYLHSVRATDYSVTTGGSNLTTTASTYVAMSGFAGTLVTTGGYVLMLFTATSDNLQYDVEINGTRRGQLGTFEFPYGGTTATSTGTANYWTHNIPHIFTFLHSGTHTFQMHFRTAGSGTGTVFAAYKPRFHVREL
jgi:hypothetical protein